MSAPEHSPLPWAIDRDERPGMEWNNHIVCAESPHLRICFMSHTEADDNKTGEANASLIVRAVNSHAELLAAAKASIELADKTVIRSDDGTPSRTLECQEIYDRVVASIAHAEEPAP